MTDENHGPPESPDEAPAQTLATPLVSMSEQVGQHLMTALSQTETVAVLTTVTGSRRGKQVISIPLSEEQLHEVQMLLQRVEESQEPDQVDCVGFHCEFNDEPSE